MDIIKDMNSKSSQFKQGFIFGLGYLTAFGISITMIMLGGWVKACTDDIKELKQQKVDECKYEEVENHGILLERMLKMKKDILENAASNVLSQMMNNDKKYKNIWIVKNAVMNVAVKFTVVYVAVNFTVMNVAVMNMAMKTFK